MSVLASYKFYSYTKLCGFRVGGSNISGEINYPPLQSVLNTNSRLMFR